MSKAGKKFTAAKAEVGVRHYNLDEAVPLAQKIKFAKFDETVELAFRLGVDPKHADQMVRGTVVLPHGLGKTKKVLAIAGGEKQKEALEAGADIVAGEEIVERIQGGFMDFEAVVATLVTASRVDIYGVGASGFVGADLQQKLHRIGRIAFSFSDSHAALASAALLKKGDVAIGISHSGMTIDTIDALSLARSRGAITVTITNSPKSPISAVADHVLTTAARETTFRSGATASRLAQLTVVDCVFVGVAQRTYAESMEALRATYEAVQNRRTASRPRRSSR